MHRVLASLLLSLALLLALVGCSSVDPAVYANQLPRLDLRDYFKGRLVGHGMVMDRGGEVTRRFVVTIDASWLGDTGTLDEDFVWSDGERQRRVWTLEAEPGAPGRWRGTAPDVVGAATGVVSGNSLSWRYTLKLPVDGRTVEVDFDDSMFLIDREVMLNRAVMSVWGFRVGEVLIAFRRT